MKQYSKLLHHWNCPWQQKWKTKIVEKINRTSHGIEKNTTDTVIQYISKDVNFVLLSNISVSKVLPTNIVSSSSEGYPKNMLPGMKYLTCMNYVFMGVKHGDSEIN